MQLPEEIGKYIQSFLRPTRPLFYFLHNLPSTAALEARKAELNAEFERRNWLRYYADEPSSLNARVTIFSYTNFTSLQHIPLSEHLRPIFIERMRAATTSDFAAVHVATCDELHVEYMLVQSRSR